MRLYHGTSEAIARKALDEGLLPRADTGIESRWTECPSRDDLVYLTTAYAGYFAVQATDKLEPWGIVEIDTDLLPEFAEYLVPDEDWLEQAVRGAPDLPDDYRALDMIERTAFWRERLHNLTHLWEESVNGLGNCAHLGPIPSSAVTRVSIFDPKSNPSIAMLALDPTISILNYQIIGGKYRAMLRWLVGDDVTPEELSGFDGFVSDTKYLDGLRRVLAMRDGLEVIETEHRL
jgi:hypothetical protein